MSRATGVVLSFTVLVTGLQWTCSGLRAARATQSRRADHR